MTYLVPALLAVLASGLFVIQDAQHVQAASVPGKVISRNGAEKNPKGVNTIRGERALKKKKKDGKSAKVSISNGMYLGIDTEDGTQQRLQILCDYMEGTCDIKMIDPSFSTCYEILGNVFGGIAFAKGVPHDHLDNFILPLYCMAQGELVIDFDKEPDALLTGNMVSLPDGGILRNGPGFYYYRVSSESHRKTGKKVKDNAPIGINGSYRGIDTEEGSTQALSIMCNEDRLCNVTLADTSWNICRRINGFIFFKGIGVARNVPQDSLKDFDISLYCLRAGELEVDINDVNRAPDDIISGDLEFIGDGILRRSVPGFTYFKTTQGATLKEDFGVRMSGTDTEDGSGQALEILCHHSLCNVTLIDASFSTCIENIAGDIYLGGLALAHDIPQESLDNFTLDLYCVESFAQLENGIDYDAEPATTLDGSIVILEGGIVRRTATNFVYYNLFKDELPSKPSKNKSKPTRTSITNGDYRGSKFFDGSEETVILSCFDGICQVTLFNVIFTECIRPETGYNAFFNGFGIARNISEDALDHFEFDVYCIGPLGNTVNIDTDEPTYKIDSAGLIPIFPAGALLHSRTSSREAHDTVYYKLSTSESVRSKSDWEYPSGK